MMNFYKKAGRRDLAVDKSARLKALLVISSSFYCETTIMGMAIMKIKKRLDHLLQICSHEILGVGELGGQS